MVALHATAQTALRGAVSTGFDLMATVFGGSDAALARVVYVLVGLSALWQLVPLFGGNARR